MRINYEIPDDLHRALKMQAASESITLRELIERLLREGIAAERKPT